MDLELEGQTVVITAAGSGIGRACTQLFLAEGAKVICADISEESLESLGRGERLYTIGLDLAEADAPGRLISFALERCGHIDVLINNLGGAAIRESFMEVDDAAWLAMWNRNVMAMVRACRAALPGMVERRRGAIVNIASTNAYQPMPEMVDYSAAKSAVRSISKCLSIEFGPYGIRVNAVSPGPTRTPAILRSIGTVMARKWNMDTEQALAHHATVINSMSLGRVGDPRDVAAVVAFLASCKACQVTGADYTVDGGFLKAC